MSGSRTHASAESTMSTQEATWSQENIKFWIHTAVSTQVPQPEIRPGPRVQITIVLLVLMYFDGSCPVVSVSFPQSYEAYGGLVVNWRTFGSSGHVQRPAGSVLSNYWACNKKDDRMNRFIKTIANTRCAVVTAATTMGHASFPESYYAAMECSKPRLTLYNGDRDQRRLREARGVARADTQGQSMLSDWLCMDSKLVLH